MSLVVNHNLMAMNVARNLSAHYAHLSSSTQKLSTGLRINSAADDAAGLAIRELQRADIQALHQGMRNANDAISLIQTADGALAIIDEKLIRMKELAEQAATGTYNSIQRLMIESEYQQMASEITRIANATDFNGVKLLNGNLSALSNDYWDTAKGAFDPNDPAYLALVAARDAAWNAFVNARNVYNNRVADANAAHAVLNTAQANYNTALAIRNQAQVTKDRIDNLAIDITNQANDLITHYGVNLMGANAAYQANRDDPVAQANLDQAAVEFEVHGQGYRGLIANLRATATAAGINDANFDALLVQLDNFANPLSATWANYGKYAGHTAVLGIEAAKFDTYLADLRALQANPNLAVDTALQDQFNDILDQIDTSFNIILPELISIRDIRRAEAGAGSTTATDNAITATTNNQNEIRNLRLALDFNNPATVAAIVNRVNTVNNNKNTQILVRDAQGRDITYWSRLTYSNLLTAARQTGLTNVANGINAETAVLANDAQNNLNNAQADLNTAEAALNAARADATAADAAAAAALTEMNNRWRDYLAAQRALDAWVNGKGAANYGKIHDGANLDAAGALKVHFGTLNDSAEDYYYIEIGDCRAFALGLGMYHDDRLDEKLLGLGNGNKATLFTKESDGRTVSTQAQAQKALLAVNEAIVSKDKIRAYLGAMQNRLENTITNIVIQAANLQASESRISDVDVATEMTNFTRQQILSQSAVAMLSQANVLPQMALQLIG